MKKCSVIFFLLTMIFAKAFAKVDSASWNITITPQNLFNNCLRLDFEHRLSANNWIGIGPQYYFGAMNTNDSSYGPLSTIIKYNTAHKPDVLSGAGLMLEDKIFLRPRYSGYSGFYFNYGFSYSRLKISYQDNTWVPYQQNGATYFGFSPANGSLNISREDVILAFGYTAMDNRSFHADITFGGVVQTTTTAYSGLGSGYRNFNRNVFDFQYDGVYPLFTIQFGFLF